MKHEDLTRGILKVFYQVYNELGFGFLEKVYQNSMYLALKQEGYYVSSQQKIDVYFRGIKVGEYFADLVVNELVIVELKSATAIVEEFEAQLLNYLRGTNMEVGLLLNFGQKSEVKRKVYDNSLKPNLNKNNI